MVVLELDDSLSVTIARNPPDRCVYTVIHGGEEVARYETSADPRTAGGRVGLRNVVRRNVPGYGKSAIEGLLAAEIEERADELAEELGPR